MNHFAKITRKSCHKFFFYKKGTPQQVLFWEFCETFQNNRMLREIFLELRAIIIFFERQMFFHRSLKASLAPLSTSYYTLFQNDCFFCHNNWGKRKSCEVLVIGWENHFEMFSERSLVKFRKAKSENFKKQNYFNWNSNCWCNLS